MDFLKNYLGDKSYIAIKDKLIDGVMNCKPNTMRGQQLVSQLYESVVTNNSVSPMMEIKSFQTNAEAVSKEDVSLAELLKFIKTEQSGGDFNYLINLCKEEHYANLKRNGITTPEKTVEDIMSYFNEPSNVIIEAIKNDLFSEKLNSNLYAELRNEFAIAPETGFNKSSNKIKKLNESVLINANGLMKYNPIGIKYATPDVNHYITPDTIVHKGPNGWAKSNDLELPTAFNALNVALIGVDYSYDTDKFMLSSEWDFNMCIDSEGLCKITNNGEEIVVEKQDLPGLFAESLGFLPPEVNKELLMAEADRFILIANNYSKLTKIDELSVIKNDNNFIVVDNNLDLPCCVDGKYGQQKFESFGSMVNTLNESFGDRLDNISGFADRLVFEQNLISERNNDINVLNENQQTLEALNKSAIKLKDKADEGSVVAQKADEEIEAIKLKTEENIEKLRNLQNKPLYEY